MCDIAQAVLSQWVSTEVSVLEHDQRSEGNTGAGQGQNKVWGGKSLVVQGDQQMVFIALVKAVQSRTGLCKSLVV